MRVQLQRLRGNMRAKEVRGQDARLPEILDFSSRDLALPSLNDDLCHAYFPIQ